MIRTHEAGSLRREHAGQQVVLAGWVARRRDHGGVTFIDLRDASGIAQVVFREEVAATRPHDLRAEFCVKVTGEVRVRPEGNENAEHPDRRRRGRRGRDRGAERGGAAAVPDRGRRQRQRGGTAQVPLPRHPPRGPGPRAARPLDRVLPRARRAARPRLRQRRDADPHPFHARGRARLPRARTPQARPLVRPAAVAAAVQAAAHGLRAWSATTRSPAATATRTPAPTGSRSSPRSTSRCPSSTRRTSSRSPRTSSAGSGARSSATRSRGRSRA